MSYAFLSAFESLQYGAQKLNTVLRNGEQRYPAADSRPDGDGARSEQPEIPIVGLAHNVVGSSMALAATDVDGWNAGASRSKNDEVELEGAVDMSPPSGCGFKASADPLVCSAPCPGGDASV